MDCGDQQHTFSFLNILNYVFRLQNFLKTQALIKIKNADLL